MAPDGIGLMDGTAFARGLAELQAAAAAGKPLPPVERWNPQNCGRIDLCIARDGTWRYLGTPIARPALVRLFSTILRREPDGTFCLVTPAERAEIVVEDAPFLAVSVKALGQGPETTLTFLTNVGDSVSAGPANRIRVEEDERTGEPRPYVLVRRGLEARIARAVFYDLVERAEPRDCGGRARLGVWSGGVFHELGDVPP
jgi:hypothetical protein